MAYNTEQKYPRLQHCKRWTVKHNFMLFHEEWTEEQKLSKFGGFIVTVKSCNAGITTPTAREYKNSIAYICRLNSSYFCKKTKWHAVAAQTVRCRGKVLSIPYVYYFTAYKRQWNGRQIIRWKVGKLDHRQSQRTLVILCKYVSKQVCTHGRMST